MSKKDYVSVVYNTDVRPFTSYPSKLTKYLFKRYGMEENSKILDIGCGRGEFLKGFMDSGMNGYGVDQSSIAKSYFSEIKLKNSNIENDGLPFEDNYFDYIFSKSVIEHFYDPQKLVKEIFRVLKPGGLVITMCPSWEFNYKTYFEDYTHRSPFMIESLGDIFKIHGFEDVEVEFFKQLPSTWEKSAFFATSLSVITRTFAPSFLRKYYKWVRFSKEIMLLSSSKKPK